MKTVLSIKGVTGKLEVKDFVKMQSTTLVLITDQSGKTYFVDSNLLQIETYPDTEILRRYSDIAYVAGLRS